MKASSSAREDNEVQAATAAQFTGVKIFSATLAEQRALLGETVTQWLRVNPQVEVVETVVTQSSDSRFHCLTLVLFFRGVAEAAQSRGPRH